MKWLRWWKVREDLYRGQTKGIYLPHEGCGEEGRERIRVVLFMKWLRWWKVRENLHGGGQTKGVNIFH